MKSFKKVKNVFNFFEDAFQTESKTSFITKDKEDEGRRKVQEILGFEPPRICGYHILVMLNIRKGDKSTFPDPKTGKETKILKPEAIQAMERWHSSVGLVIAVGDEAYKGYRFKRTGPFCKVGDWVCFARAEGRHFVYRGVPVCFVPDNTVFAPLEDPTYILRD